MLASLLPPGEEDRRTAEYAEGAEEDGEMPRTTNL
jgi:hypothetical protein